MTSPSLFLSSFTLFVIKLHGWKNTHLGNLCLMTYFPAIHIFCHYSYKYNRLFTIRTVCRGAFSWSSRRHLRPTCSTNCTSPSFVPPSQCLLSIGHGRCRCLLCFWQKSFYMHFYKNIFAKNSRTKKLF